MDTSSPPADGSSPNPKRPRGRPKKESIERENLARLLKSNVSNDVSRRFLQKLNLLKVHSSSPTAVSDPRGNENWNWNRSTTMSIFPNISGQLLPLSRFALCPACMENTTRGELLTLRNVQGSHIRHMKIVSPPDSTVYSSLFSQRKIRPTFVANTAYILSGYNFFRK